MIYHYNDGDIWLGIVFKTFLSDDKSYSLTVGSPYDYRNYRYRYNKESYL